MFCRGRVLWGPLVACAWGDEAPDAADEVAATAAGGRNSESAGATRLANTTGCSETPTVAERGAMPSSGSRIPRSGAFARGRATRGACTAGGKVREKFIEAQHGNGRGEALRLQLMRCLEIGCNTKNAVKTGTLAEERANSCYSAVQNLLSFRHVRKCTHVYVCVGNATTSRQLFCVEPYRRLGRSARHRSKAALGANRSSKPATPPENV